MKSFGAVVPRFYVFAVLCSCFCGIGPGGDPIRNPDAAWAALGPAG